MRNTIIQRSFTPPQNITSIPQITTQEVIKEFSKFNQRNNRRGEDREKIKVSRSVLDESLNLRTNLKSVFGQPHTLFKKLMVVQNLGLVRFFVHTVFLRSS